MRFIWPKGAPTGKWLLVGALFTAAITVGAYFAAVQVTQKRCCTILRTDLFPASDNYLLPPQGKFLIILNPVWIAKSEKVALIRWKHTKCINDNIKVTQQEYGPALASVIAEARWKVSSQTTHFLDCKIVFNRSHAALSYTVECAAIVHEYGHLAGWLNKDGSFHSNSPVSIMYPALTFSNIPAGCLPKK